MALEELGAETFETIHPVKIDDTATVFKSCKMVEASLC